MGIITNTWVLPSSFPPRDEPLTPAAIAQRLRTATGLEIIIDIHGGLRFPAIREKLFDWELGERSITVYGYAPAHPYLWENLDAVMMSLGGERDNAAYRWKPNPAHARLRTRWNALSPHDRVILTIPSIIGMRPFDGLLSSTARCTD
jgi:hypothetical protein